MNEYTSVLLDMLTSERKTIKCKQHKLTHEYHKAAVTEAIHCMESGTVEIYWDENHMRYYCSITPNKARTISEMLDSSGMSRMQICKKFGIPYRTLQNWDLGLRKPPEYVVQLLAAAMNVRL